MMTENNEKVVNEHNGYVERIKSLLVELNLPFLPPHIVHSVLYHPDACTRINHKFVTIEYINSDYGFDVLGQFSIAYQKDIIEYAVCIASDKIVRQDQRKYEQVQKEIGKLDKHCNLQGKLIMLKEDQFKPWLEQQVNASKLWIPEKLVTN